MTIDKVRLKAVAEAARDFNDSGVEPGTFNPYESDFHGMATPEAVLALLSEIERDKRWSGLLVQISNQWHDRYQVCLGQLRDAFAERDQLKAENESLRKDAKRYRFLRNQHWPVAELAVVCNPKVSVKIGHDCPSGDRLDQQVDGAMIRGASHD